MQRMEMTGGGFVLHKVIVPGCKGHFSAWYDAAGTLTDAEQKPGGFGALTRNVKRGGPVWTYLGKIGKGQAARST